MKYLIFIMNIFINAFYGQILEFRTEFGSFKESGSFDIDLNGNFYITDLQENNITKLDSLGNEIISIGGYGWSESSFDEPVSVVTNTLSVYIADKNNDRVQRFDKDLNFLSLYSGRENNSGVEFAYPISLDISKVGDLYILESDNNRILKFNLTGEYLMEIGGNDAGIFALNNPKDFEIDNSGNLYVLDSKSIKVFDQYGNGQTIIETSESVSKLVLEDDYIFLIDNNEILFYSLKDRKISSRFADPVNIGEDRIVELNVSNNYFYILLSNKILKYKLL